MKRFRFFLLVCSGMIAGVVALPFLRAINLTLFDVYLSGSYNDSILGEAWFLLINTWHLGGIYLPVALVLGGLSGALLSGWQECNLSRIRRTLSLCVLLTLSLCVWVVQELSWNWGWWDSWFYYDLPKWLIFNAELQWSIYLVIAAMVMSHRLTRRSNDL